MRGRAVVFGTLVSAVAASRPGPVEAQASPIPAGVSRPVESAPPSFLQGSVLATPARRALADGDSSSRTPTAWAVLASAILAGSGQAILGQDRFVAYLAVEGYLWTQYVRDQREGAHERRTYRRIAAVVARSPFTAAPKDGDWDYYERMEHFLESGVFDRSAGGLELQPEVDTSTYNGAIWLLARETYWKDPNQAPDRGSEEWRRAEIFYRSRAIGPDRQWSWRGSAAAYDDFRRTIRRSNDAFRRSLTDIGVIIANHALSTVDAFVTVRLHRRPSQQGGYAVQLDVPFDLGR